MGAVHDIRIDSPYNILQIEDIKIEYKPNEHGYLYIKCLIDSSTKLNATINANSDDKICIYEKTDEKKVIFNGIIKSISTEVKANNYFLEIEAISYSYLLDIKVKSRSFQNVNMTYEDLVRERKEVINVTLEDIKALKPLIEKALKDDAMCTIGNENKVEESPLFKEKKYLMNI